MSLLLDALKKAAQKKADKSGAHQDSVDTTEVANKEATLGLNQHDDTAINATEVILPDSTLTEVLSEATEIDNTSIDYDSTQINQDTQFLEETEIDSTSVETVEINKISVDQDSTLINQDTQFLEATNIDATSIDATELNETSYDSESTQLEQNTQFIESTQVDPTAIEKTEINISKGETAAKHSRFDNDQTVVGEDVKFVDTTQMDVTSLEGAEVEANSVIGANTEATFTDTDALYRAKFEAEEDGLTDDDVTQFMGDGVTSQNTIDSVKSNIAGGLDASEDTTITNPESLTLTNFSFTEEESVGAFRGRGESASEYYENDTHSLQGVATGDDRTNTIGINQQDVAEDEKLTLLNTDETSTISSVDIEKLTNDETVTVSSSTSTKTFAPDNYDRTLLNLSEQDVSNIFPGMRPDSDTVMTPDYAKRIFLSKSNKANTSYYKVYAGIGLVFLLSVIMWGMFQLQEETVKVEQSLMSLKRDPMPGMIKPPVEKIEQSLFAIDSTEEAVKAIDLLSKVETSGGMVDSGQEGGLESGASMQEAASNVEASSSEIATSDGQNIQKKIIAVSNNKSVKSETASTSGLIISSNRQVSRKSQILMEAYEAYERGDVSEAAALYNKVLSLDESNRDGLLGRAAIHVRQNEYQQAINKYQQLLVANPKDSMAMAALISVASIDPQAGESQLKSLLRDQPDSPYLHFVLGNMYGSQNRWNEAQGAYFEALQQKPNDPNYAYNLAVSLEHIGKAGVASTFYQRALDNSSKGLVTFDDQLVMQRLEVLAQ